MRRQVHSCRQLGDRPQVRERQIVTVLVVDDEESVLREVCELLGTFRIATEVAKSSTEALQVIRSTRIDLALVDWRLAGQDDGIVLGRVLQHKHGIPFVLFSGFLNTEVTVHAMRFGAADVVDKPIRPRKLLAALRLGLGYGQQHPFDGHERRSAPGGYDSVSKRWAKMALKACGVEDDPKTESGIAEAAGVSTSVFRRDCKECCIEPRDARDFIRLLRANALAQRDGSTLRSHLATSDPRTRKQLFERAGLPFDSRFVPLKVFFVTQRLISQTKECLRALGHLAANDKLFFLEPEDRETRTEDG